MKTNTWLHLCRTLWAVGLVTAFALPASATGKESEQNYTGTIMSVDAKENTVSVRAHIFSKKFVLAEDCTFAQWEKGSPSLNDFHPGQRVDISYKNVGGVLVADRVMQEALRFSGTVQVIDVNNHTLIVHRRGMIRTFMVADNCQVLRNGKHNEGINKVKWGDRVTVVYEAPGDHTLAREIELPDTVFTGSLGAIDLDNRTISAGKRYLADKKFRLADDCIIITNGKADGRLSDLRLGRNYELNYETVGGVNVVSRIATAEPTMKGEERGNTARTEQSIPPEE